MTNEPIDVQKLVAEVHATLAAIYATGSGPTGFHKLVELTIESLRAAVVKLTKERDARLVEIEVWRNGAEIFLAQNDALKSRIAELEAEIVTLRAGYEPEEVRWEAVLGTKDQPHD